MSERLQNLSGEDFNAAATTRPFETASTLSPRANVYGSSIAGCWPGCFLKPPRNRWPFPAAN
jgi:hypothetical protein